MSPSRARSLRKALGLPRLPQSMDAVQRLSYRTLKTRFKKLPSPARAIFMRNLHLLQGTVTTQSA